MSATVDDLEPGDVVEMGGQRATFVAKVSSHPLWPSLRLVIWKMHDPAQTWSHDALDGRQVVGEVVSPTVEREANLRHALLHRSQW